MALEREELEYFEAVRAAFGLPVPQYEPYDAHCIFSILQSTDFIYGDVNTATHPSSGSLYVDSEVMAALFPDISGDPAWWRSMYQHLQIAGREDECFRKWLNVLRSRAAVL